MFRPITTHLLMTMSVAAGCTGAPRDSDKDASAQQQRAATPLCNGRIQEAIIESYYNSRGEAKQTTRSIRGPQILNRLAGFFPEAGQGKKSPSASGADAYAVIHCECKSGTTVDISISFYFDSWSEGEGDWPVQEPEELRQFLLELLEADEA